MHICTCLNKHLNSHLALLGAQIVYALNYSIAKGLMPQFISPTVLVFYRIVGAMFLFYALSLFLPKEKVSKSDLKKMLWLSLFGVVINQFFFIYGLSITTPINSSVIMISNPIMVFVFTLIVLKEKLTIYKILGLLLAITGCYIILSYKGNFEIGSDTIKGDLMTLINATSWAIFVVLAKPLMVKYHTVTVMKWLFLFGAIFYIPFGLNETINTNYLIFTPKAIFALCFVVIATTFLAYLLNLYGLKKLSPNVVSMYIYLQPFLASTFAIIIGEDKLTLTKIVSGIIIICGLYLVNLKTKQIKHD